MWKIWIDQVCGCKLCFPILHFALYIPAYGEHVLNRVVTLSRYPHRYHYQLQNANLSAIFPSFFIYFSILHVNLKMFISYYYSLCHLSWKEEWGREKKQKCIISAAKTQAGSTKKVPNYVSNHPSSQSSTSSTFKTFIFMVHLFFLFWQNLKCLAVVNHHYKNYSLKWQVKLIILFRWQVKLTFLILLSLVVD